MRDHTGPKILLLDPSVYNPSTPLHSFQTRRGRQVCADPSEAWVQEYVTDLELSAWMAWKLWEPSETQLADQGAEVQALETLL